MRTRLLSVLAVALLLAACGGSDKPKPDTSELQKRLSAARASIDQAETINVSLEAGALPDGVTGLQSATGQGNHSPAFKGKVKVVTGGSTLTADVISADGVLKAKTSFAPVYLKVDPASLKAPDPAQLLDAENGITRILDETDGLTVGEESRDGDDILTTISGTLPGSLVSTIIPSAESQATFTVDYRLTENDELRDATLRGPFYPGAGDVSYTVALSTSDEPVDIKVP